jgi:hypothetical protein
VAAKRKPSDDAPKLKAILEKLKGDYAFTPEYKDTEVSGVVDTLLPTITTEFDVSGAAGTMQTTVYIMPDGQLLSGGIDLKVKTTQIDMATRNQTYYLDGGEVPVSTVKTMLTETSFVVKVVRNVMSGIGELAKEDVWVTVIGKN